MLDMGLDFIDNLLNRGLPDRELDSSQVLCPNHVPAMLTQSRDKVVQLHFYKATDSPVDLIKVILRDWYFTYLQVR
ncbi:hypothetical protein D3C81_1988950 [compost metagenome]